MSHANPSDQELKALLASSTTIAIVGASSNPEKASHGVMQKLQRAGYRVIPVNPRESEVLGERSYPSLIDVPERIDIVDVFRRAEDAAAIAHAGGLMVMMDVCIGATHARLRIPPKMKSATEPA